MNILLTGGTGYIGSHTCVALLDEGHNVVIVDNLSNSKEGILKQIKLITGKEIDYYKVDVTDENRINNIFKRHRIDGVIHLSGYKSILESFEKPIEYYINNVSSTLTLAKACIKYKVNHFIFSSTANVYGCNEPPFAENLIPTYTNPYGNSKLMSETILEDIVKANPSFCVSILRYFNPIGAHSSGLIGEEYSGYSQNLMTRIIQVAKREIPKIKVFGNDYPTIDGTCVRDYIHVMDLAEGHVAAMNYIKKGVSIYNIGTGKGTSVLELIKVFENVNGVKIPIEIVNRRHGDIPLCYAKVLKAEDELGWKAKRNIDDMCRDVWRFININRESSYKN